MDSSMINPIVILVATIIVSTIALIGAASLALTRAYYGVWVDPTSLVDSLPIFFYSYHRNCRGDCSIIAYWICW
jgi:hypothetical protein